MDKHRNIESLNQIKLISDKRVINCLHFTFGFSRSKQTLKITQNGNLSVIINTYMSIYDNIR